MAKAKKKAAKKQSGKAAKKKTSAKRKPAVKARAKSSVKKSAAKKSTIKKTTGKRTPGKKRTVKKSAADGVRLGVAIELDTRLRNLATQMGKSLEEVLIQAMTEFADNWEDHMRTVRNLNTGDDRMQLAVRDDDNTL